MYDRSVGLIEQKSGENINGIRVVKFFYTIIKIEKLLNSF